MRSKDHEHQAAKDGAIAECCGEMQKCFSGKIADQWGAMKKVHENSQAYHTGAAKAVEDELGKRMVPDHISSVASMDTPNFGIKAVPRHGAPSVDLDKTVINSIDPRFRHLINAPEDEA